MADQYTRDLMRVAVAQICQTIGYNATQTTPLELLQDTLHKFLHEFSRDLRRQVEHYNRTDANLNDTCNTLNSLNINVSDMLDYINNVEPVPFTIEVPKFPAHKDTNLNFLKPGSKEVLTRPVHIYEHLPPILPPDDPTNGGSSVPHYMHNGNSQDKELVAIQSTVDGGVDCAIAAAQCNALLDDKQKNNAQTGSEPSLGGFLFAHKRIADKESGTLPPFIKISSSNASHMLDDEGRPTREIISVVMTTGGFISPAIEGKLPDAMIPDLIEKLHGLDAPPLSRPASRPASRASENTGPNTSNINKTTEIDSATTSTSAQAKSVENVKNVPTISATIQSESIMPGSSDVSNSVNIGEKSVATANDLISTLAANKPSPFRAQTSAAALNSPQTPTMVSKLLKKAKKKQSPNSPFGMQGKFGGRLDYLSNPSSGGMALSQLDANDKAQRKAMRMLQKLNKSSKSLGGGSGEHVDLVGYGKFKGFVNPTMVAALPPGPERFQMEKLLKKQAKHKQKLLKQQMALEFQNRSTEAPTFPIKNSTSETKIGISNDILVKDTTAVQLNLKAGGADVHASTSTKPMYPSLPFPTNILDTLQAGQDIKSSSIFSHTGNDTANIGVAGASDFNTTETHEKKTSLEIKLSNEPDRSKLNIFKKISKQKGLKANSPNAMRMPSTLINASKDCSTGPVINLPSGTTITPAPPALGRHAYPPDNTDSILDKLGDRLSAGSTAGNMGLERGAMSHSYSSGPALTEVSLFGSLVEDNMLMNKPKKRGRKPGSKNHTKVLADALTMISPPKKIRKLKMDKNLYGPSPSVFPMKTPDQPLNLTNQFGNASDLVPNFAMSLTKSFSMLEPTTNTTSATILQAQMKERKDRKKLKPKNLPAANVSATTTITTTPESNLSVPTKEEVNSINKKLMRMDTVLKPAPPISTKMHLIDSAKDLAHSPTKSKKSPGSSKKRMQQQQQQQLPQRNSPNLLPPTLAASFMPTAGPGFANLSANMLSMMPMYPFPSRPGLIPSPGLFPAPGVLGGFANNPANVAGSNMLLSAFLPFSKLKTSATGKMAMKDIDTNDHFVEPILQAGERSYCNVASLVPESMKFTTPDAKTDRGQSSSSANSNERDYPKTPKTHHSPAASDAFSDGLFKKIGSSTTPDSNISVDSKSMPPTPGGMSLNTYEALSRKNTQHCTEISPTTTIGTVLGGSVNLSKTPTPDSHKSSINIFAQGTTFLNEIKTPSGGLLQRTIGKTTTVLNVDDTIEVSDDSLEATPKTPLLSAVPKPKTIGGQSFTKPALMSSSFVMQSNMDDIFTPNTSLVMTSETTDLLNKDVKKLKKSSKFTKNKSSSFISAQTPASGVSAVPLDVFGSSTGGDKGSGGVGKLAGGADLIPLAGTGLAYSSKTIPVTSLTAAATPSFSAHKSNFGQANIFDNLTITPAAPPPPNLDLQKKQRSKENKKIKKIKEGKIKKKKDKKDKSKSKERAEKYLLKTDKELKEKDLLDKPNKEKDMLKKLKKEKKKEKQRMTIDSWSASTTFAINKTSGVVALNAVYDSAAAVAAAAGGVGGVSASENMSPLSSLPPSSTSSSLSSTPATSSSAAAGLSLTNTAASLVPKLTLKLGSCQSPTPVDDTLQNLNQSTTPSTPSSSEREKREPSPELARISPLVTRPPKQKLNSNDTSNTTAVGVSSASGNSTFDASSDNSKTISSSTANISAHTLVPPPSPWLSGGTLTASSVLLPQQLLQITKTPHVQTSLLASSSSNTITTNPTESLAATPIKSTADAHSPVPLISEASRPSSYIDAEGNRVWICPACGKVDDGSAMIGCDGCDAWYHWVCVGIFVAPKDNEDWFCRVCITRKKGIHGTDKKRKRNKKK